MIIEGNIDQLKNWGNYVSQSTFVLLRQQMFYRKA
jgi:hypothetical protein